MMPISEEEIEQRRAAELEARMYEFDLYAKRADWPDYGREALIALADGDEFAKNEPFPMDPHVTHSAICQALRERDDTLLGMIVRQAIQAKLMPSVNDTIADWMESETERRERDANRSVAGY